MSLVRIALRFATMKALKGRTIAEDRVRDSEIGPLDEIDTDAPAPVIIIFTDEATLEVPRRDLLSQRGSHALVIEIAITSKMKNRPGAWEIPLTDAGMELSLEVIDREINVALMDPTNAWAEIWRRFATPAGKSERRRGASAGRDGVRTAGSQLVLPVELIKDPTPGEPLSELWETFFTMAEAEADLAPIVPLLRSLAAGAGGLTNYEGVRAAYGLTKLEAKALLIEPAATNEAAPAIASVALDETAAGDDQAVVDDDEVPA